MMLRAAENRSSAAADRAAAAESRIRAAVDREQWPVTVMGPLVIANVDVVGLKAINDEHGHGAGDALLQHAVNAIRAHLRSDDLIVRVGGDGFMCVMSGATIEYAHQRFAAIQAALAADSDRCEIKVGFAALAAEDSAAELIHRADAELLVSARSWRRDAAPALTARPWRL